MPEDTPQPPPPPPPPALSEPVATPAEPQIPFNIGEEFGTARKNLPPTKILLLAVAGIALITAVVGLVQKPRQTVLSPSPRLRIWAATPSEIRS